jgi:hypothetical protein
MGFAALQPIYQWLFLSFSGHRATIEIKSFFGLEATAGTAG